jgi:DNA invertase Pin-like site-specific DNA recombinase
MIVGYARTSTVGQVAGLEGQIRELEAAGCERIFSEQTSAVGPRPILDQALAFVRQNDVFTVTKPDRLARSTADLLNMVDSLTKRGIRLRILSMGGMELDTSQATSKLMLTTLAAMATFERELMLERQREGIRKAVEAGKYRGRAPTARQKSDAVQELREAGIGPAEIARRLSISRASVYRIIGVQAAV